MSVDEKTVKHVAKLSRLNLTVDEVKYYQNHLNKIVEYVERLKSVKDDVTFPETKIGTFERDDIVKPSLPTDESLSQAPKKIGTAFQVPKILDN